MLALVLLIVLWTAPAYALVTIEGTSVRMEIDEPAANVDGTPLTDLQTLIGYYQVPGDVETECGRAPASAPTGGGTVSVSCLVPVGAGREANVSFRARAMDTSGNYSAYSGDVIHRIDHLPPARPRL
jgi:hypothetical protein